MPGVLKIPGWLARQGGADMQDLMLKLDRVLVRRRWWVLGAWAAALVAAVPCAARQSEHLTGGGFGVPGSQSAQVASIVDQQFGEAGRAKLAAVVVAARGASAADVRTALDRVRAAADAAPEVGLTSAALREAERHVGAPTILVPLAT